MTRFVELFGRTSRHWLLWLGSLSLALYGVGVVGLRFASTSSDVVGFLTLFAALFVLYGLAGLLVLRREHSVAGNCGWILVFALLFRLVFLFVGIPQDRFGSAVRAELSGATLGMQTFLAYDNDVWRYLWDGHPTASGVATYRYSPDEIESQPALERLLLGDDDRWWELFERVDHRGYRTIYPPLAQWLFVSAHALLPASALLFKLQVVLIDVVNCWLLFGLARRLRIAPERTLIYSWNPLVVQEFAGSGHIDSLVVLCLLLTARAALSLRPSLTGGVFVAGLLVKPSSALLAPLLIRRFGFRATLHGVIAGFGAALLLSLPWIEQLPDLARNLGAFARDWEFNAGPFRLFRSLAEVLYPPAALQLASIISGTALLLVVIWVVRRDDGSDRRLIDGMFVILAATVLLSPTVMPWYLTWALPFAVLRRRWSFVALTALSLLSYLIYIDQTERAVWLWIEYGLFGICLLFDRER